MGKVVPFSASVLLLLGACTPPPQPPTASASAGATLSLAPGAGVTRGDLLVYWLMPGEAERDMADPARWNIGSMLAARHALDRVMARAHVDLAKTPRLPIAVTAPPGALVFALLVTHGGAFNSLLEPAAGDWLGAAPVGNDVVLAPIGPGKPRREPCSGERDHLEVIDAPEVAGSIGNDTRRRICVHLPAGYAATSGRRYPVVYVLRGFGGSDSGGSIGMIFRAADELPAERQAIFVGVNIATKAGASYLTRSPLSGDFDAFLTTTVPTFVDRSYATIPTAAARGLIGQSTGGFDVVSLALRHSDRFNVVAESSADGLDFASWMLRPDGRGLAPFPLAVLRLEDAVGPPGQMSSYAADWSPDPKARWGFRWPADPATGELVESVWKQWLANSPSELVKDPAILAGARARLSGKLLIAAGTADDFDLHEPSRRFSEQLNALGVVTVFASDAGDHGGTMDRKRTLVRFAAEHLTAARPAP